MVRASLAELRIRRCRRCCGLTAASRAPHLRTWRDGWRHLRFLLAFSPRWLLLYPSMAFQGVGLAGMPWLLLGPRVVGPVVLDVHSMLGFATMFVLGVQGLGLAVTARLYAAQFLGCSGSRGGWTSCSAGLARTRAGARRVLLVAGAGCWGYVAPYTCRVRPGLACVNAVSSRSPFWHWAGAVPAGS